MSKEKHSIEELEHFDGWKTVAKITQTFNLNGELETDIEDVVYNLEKKEWSKELAATPKNKRQPLYDKSPGSLQGEVRGRPGLRKWAWRAHLDGSQTETWNGHAPTPGLGIMMVDLIIEWLNETKKKPTSPENAPDQIN